MTETTKDAARERYIAEHDSFVEAAESMRVILQSVCQAARCPKAQINVRAKAVGSFVKKLRKYGDDCWEKMTDKVGAQIVPKTLREVNALRLLLETGSHGLVHRYTIDKAADEDPRTLYYSGVHIQVLVPVITTSDGEAIECEIQLRSAALDLWASLEHGLIYKPIVAPSRQVARKMARLSVLVEMFDEEVDMAMTEIESDPRYADALLLRTAETYYHTFVSEPGDETLSLDVLHAIRGAFVVGELDEYATTLADFVEDSRTHIAEIYDQFGIGTTYSEQFSYFLFTQPESIIVLERVANRPMLLASAVRGSELANAVDRLATAWGQTLAIDI
ncbi:ppGpp synthetase catalytic domain-containing protein (RelA/SpoT-type nucleotidyltranferase) [Nakamurella panacisegetis]|uniref:PpGpp synthetase catalytic domain-containing protein (RelA/SpoT-type nucleotidyltranferase) n=1 Tax=Nakamurella panacisegetis TaxID=1090615 RepID=A0A1H0LFN4_9ACTN|nr:hypothetical protein [Nakamurella panacisegetis]SDO66893.1 ppGpp synthetase catalytic domain-containing protein (RelA/SpoT-type nucleotidyltranferase) [Nakamurella panacisegetis]